MATIEKRYGNWRAKVRRSNITHSKTFPKKSDAKTWATETERAIALGLPLSNHGATLASVLQRYTREVTPLKRGASVELLRIRVILRHKITQTPLNHLTSTHIAKYRDDRLKKVAAGTVRRELGIFSHALETARKEWGYYLPSNPVAGIRKPIEPRGRDRRLEGDEEQRLLDACMRSTNHWLLPLVCFALETAMRRGELLALEWKDVHVAQSWVHLSDTKNGSPRDVPLSPKAQAILADLPHDLSGIVFPVHFGALKSAWRRLLGRSGVVGLRFHDLRHEATSRFFEKGLNVMEVAAITGHRDLRMLQRYTHLRAEDLALKL